MVYAINYHQDIYLNISYHDNINSNRFEVKTLHDTTKRCLTLPNWPGLEAVWSTCLGLAALSSEVTPEEEEESEEEGLLARW